MSLISSFVITFAGVTAARAKQVCYARSRSVLSYGVAVSAIDPRSALMYIGRIRIRARGEVVVRSWLMAAEIERCYTAARHSLRISLAKCVDSTHIELNRFYELSVSRHLAPGWIDGTRGNLPCDRSIHGGFSVFYGRLCEAPKAIAALRYGLGKIAIDSWIALDRLGCQTRYVRFGHVRWCWIRLFWLWSKG